MSKHTLLFSILFLLRFTSTSYAQDTTKFGHLKQITDMNWIHSIMFTTANYRGAGTMEWCFRRDTIWLTTKIGDRSSQVYMKVYIHPYISLDTPMMAAYSWETREGALLTLIWSDPVNDFVALDIKGKRDTTLDIDHTVHFW